MGIEAVYLSRKNYFENYAKFAKEIKTLAKSFFKENFSKLLVFGSVVKGRFSVGLSDIDIAVLLKKEVPLKEKIKFMVLVDEKFSGNPFEIHVVSEERWEKWYKRFVRNEFIEV